jgi:hypothetical protein
MAWVCESNIPTSDRILSAKLVPTLADSGCHVVSVTDIYGHIFDFLDCSRVGNQTQTSGSVAGISDL